MHLEVGFVGGPAPSKRVRGLSWCEIYVLFSTDLNIDKRNNIGLTMEADLT